MDTLVPILLIAVIGALLVWMALRGEAG